MRFFDQFSKNRTGPDEDNFTIFLPVVALAAVVLTCLLIYVLMYPALFGDDEPEYQIVPYSTATPQSAQPVGQPTATLIAPLPTTITTPLPTQPPTEPISVQTAQRVNELRTLIGHSSAVNSVAYSPDGRYLASGDLAGLVKLWDARTYVEIYTFQSDSNRVDSVAFSPDGTRLVAAGQDNVVRQWSLTDGSALTSLTGPTGAINSLAFSPTGAFLAAASDDGDVYIWNMPGGTLLGQLPGHTSYVTSVAFNADGSILAAGGEDDTVRVWSVPGGVSYGVIAELTSTVWDVAFSPDGTTLATTSADSVVRLWDVLSLSLIRQLSGHTENVNGVAFAPDGQLLVSAAGGITDNTVRLWDRQAGTQVGILYPAGPASSVAFSPSGLYLAVGGANFLSIWGVTNAQQPTGPVVSQPVQTPAGVLDGQGGQAAITPGGNTCVLTVRLNDVNVRSGPGVNYLYMSTLNLNDTVQAVGWAVGIDGDGFTWWRTSDGGWVRGDVFIDAANPSPPDACWTLAQITAIPPTPNATLPVPSQTPVTIQTQTSQTPTGSCVMTVRVEQANIRSGVGTDSPIIGQLLQNQTIQVTGWSTGPELFTWWKTNTGGWIRGDAFVDAINTSVPDACWTLPQVQ